MASQKVQNIRSSVCGRLNLIETIGSVFLTNTAVCHASRAVHRPGPLFRSFLSTGDGILNLLCLLDAAVLYDRIYCLPATLPADADDLKLRETLISAGAVKQVPAEVDFGMVGHALLAALSSVDGYKVKDDNAENAGLPFTFSDFRNGIITCLGLHEESRLPPDPGDQPLPWPDAANASSFTDAAHKLLAFIQSMQSGSDATAGSELRAMYYVYMAEHLSIPYWPSPNMQKMGSRFPNYFTSSTRSMIYSQLAKALKAATDTVAREFEGSRLFVPPFSAIVLDRAAGPEYIAAELLALREEYGGFRARMLDLECERREAKSIDSRLKVIRQTEALCREVSKPFDSQSPMIVETTLRYIPGIVDLVTAPSNPAVWTRVFLEKPVEWLIEWYRRRPVSKLVRTAEQVASLDSYDDLVIKHFGLSGADELQFIQDCTLSRY